MVKDAATVDAHGYVYIHIGINAVFEKMALMPGVSSYRRGLLRCSFYYIGQCEGLRVWDE
jgi:hypothetical protein